MSGEGERKAGFAAAIGATGAGEVPRERAEQLPLLPDLTAEVDEAGNVQVDAGGNVVPMRRGPGRPPGARNRRTEDRVEYIAKRYGMPLERLAQIWSADPRVYAAEHGLDVDEALDDIRDAAKAALPYMHQKQPLAVDVTRRQSFTFHFVEPQAVEEAAEDAITIHLAATELESENDGESET